MKLSDPDLIGEIEGVLVTYSRNVFSSADIRRKLVSSKRLDEITLALEILVRRGFARQVKGGSHTVLKYGISHAQRDFMKKVKLEKKRLEARYQRGEIS